MTATNHAVTGALIGLLVANPAVAIPAAFLSHFVCDAIPHYGDNRLTPASNRFKRLLLVDMMLCLALVAAMAYRHPVHWLLASVCAFLATSPDLLWLPKFFRALKNKKPQKESQLEHLLGGSGIQWFEKPVGAFVEVAWLVAGLSLIALFVS